MSTISSIHKNLEQQSTLILDRLAHLWNQPTTSTADRDERFVLIWRAKPLSRGKTKVECYPTSDRSIGSKQVVLNALEGEPAFAYLFINITADGISASLESRVDETSWVYETQRIGAEWQLKKPVCSNTGFSLFGAKK